jgi:hypothetical protein
MGTLYAAVVRYGEVLHIGLTVLGGFLSFVVLFDCTVESYLDQPGGSLHDAILRGSLSKGSSLISLALISLLGIDGVLDFIQEIRDVNALRASWTTDKAWKTIQNATERVTFLSGMILVPICSFLPSNTANVALVWLTCNRAELILVGGSTYASFCRTEPTFSHPYMTLIMYVLFVFGTSFGGHTGNDPLNRAFYWCAFVGSYAGVAIFVFALLRQASRYSYQLVFKSWVWSSFTHSQGMDTDPGMPDGSASTNTTHATTNASSQTDESIEYRFVFVVLMLLWTVMKIWVETLPAWNALVDYELLLLSIPNLFLQFMFAIFTMRLVKHDAILTALALRSERQYSRCITNDVEVSTSRPSSNRGDSDDLAAANAPACPQVPGGFVFHHAPRGRRIKFFEEPDSMVGIVSDAPFNVHSDITLPTAMPTAEERKAFFTPAGRRGVDILLMAARGVNLARREDEPMHGTYWRRSQRTHSDRASDDAGARVGASFPTPSI